MEQKKYMKNQLIEFTNELERQMKPDNRQDLIVPTNTNQLLFGTDGKTMWLDVPQPEGSSTPFRSLQMTEYVQRSIASYYGVHASYFRKMKAKGKLSLICRNINEWIPTETKYNKRLIRTLDNEVIGYLGPHYFCINNYDLVSVVFKKLKEIAEKTGITYDVQRIDLTESHLYMKITSPQLQDEVHHFRQKGEAVEGGIIIRNTEVGDGAFIVEPFINVLVCTNGLIRTKIIEKYKQVHRGKEQDIGTYGYNTAIYNAKMNVIIEQVRGYIDTVFTPEIFHKWVDEINGKAKIELPKPVVAIDNLITHFNLSETMKDVILNQFTKEASPTVWGLSMAVTRVAQDEKDYESQINMERIGAKILEMNPTILTKEKPKKDETKEE